MIGRVIITCVLSACCYTAWSSSTPTAPVPRTSSECGRPNRVYVSCAPSCKEVNITCDHLRGERDCEVYNELCKGSCICKEGFYENENGECVLEENCYKCKKPNEVFACGSACDSECSTIGKTCDVVNKVCTEKCYCRKGYSRNIEGECVRHSQCPGVPTCNKDKNEEYSCHRTCPPKICVSVISLYACPKEPECKFQCDCKDELLRNSKGECVSRETCLYEIDRLAEEWKKSMSQTDPPVPLKL